MTDVIDREEALDEESRALAPVSSSMPAPLEFEAMRSMASAIANTQMVPTAYRGKPDEILACALTARELGIGPMYALKHIQIIEGKPGLSAELMVTLIRRAGHSVRPIETTNHRAAVWGKRRDNGDELTAEFTIEDARRIKVKTKNGDWKALAEASLGWRNYPGDLCWARAVSRLARRNFSDCLAGLGYTPEELESIHFEKLDEDFDKARRAITTDSQADLPNGNGSVAGEGENRLLTQGERNDLKLEAGARPGDKESMGPFRKLVADCFRELDDWQGSSPDYASIRVRHATWIREQIQKLKGQDPDDSDPDSEPEAGQQEIPVT